MAAEPGPTEPIKLTDIQLRLIPELLSYREGAYGFRGEVWTCALVATVLWKEFSASYHKAHVSRLLRRLRWTPQLPVERAAQRDEALVKQWRIKVWPELKKKHAQKAGPLSLWTRRDFISCRGGSAHTRHADRHRCCGGHIAAIMCR
jgi:hypothetical protein